MSDDIGMYYGPRLKAGCNPTSDREMYVFVVENTPEVTRPPREQWPELIRELLSDFGGIIGWARERMTDPEKIDRRPLHAILMPPPWYRGRVLLIGDAAGRIDALRAGAAAFVEEPVEPAALERALIRLERLTEASSRRIAFIGAGNELDDELVALLSGGEGVEVRRIDAGSVPMAVHAEAFDLGLIVVSGDEPFALVREWTTDHRLRELPTIAFVREPLPRSERARLDALAKSAVMTVVDSPERVADRAALYLHRVETALPAQTRILLGRLRTGDAPLQGKKVLVVDDDIRNVFALTSTLEQRGMKVVFAENGREGIERLHQHPNTDLVLLDIMMPEMDGYETAQAIRAMPRFEHLPIISLTAKAMKGDREKAIAAGASDYITKPVDVDQLVSMMRVWLDA
jgi:CheY-like chemotaxis protein